MARFGLIGSPIGHSLSPRLFSAAYGGALPYDLIETDDFGKAFGIFLGEDSKEGYDAVNVTMPFKALALEHADIAGEECLAAGAANILVKDADGLVHAHNSDVAGVRSLIPQGVRTVLVAGFGGAGRAACAAAESLGLEVTVANRTVRSEGMLSLDDIRGGRYDMVIYTLPVPVEQISEVTSEFFLEANYASPSYQSRHGYIPGIKWLAMQAIHGYRLMTGLDPDSPAILAAALEDQLA